MDGGLRYVEEHLAPPPRFVDPHYQGRAQTVRAWLDGDLFGGCGKNPILPIPRFDENAMLDVLFAQPINWDNTSDHLNYIGRAWHFAPFTGEPFIYWWRIAQDQDGRFCTGEQNIRHIDQWEYERLRGRDPFDY